MVIFDSRCFRYILIRFGHIQSFLADFVDTYMVVFGHLQLDFVTFGRFYSSLLNVFSSQVSSITVSQVEFGQFGRSESYSTREINHYVNEKMYL